MSLLGTVINPGAQEVLGGSRRDAPVLRVPRRLPDSRLARLQPAADRPACVHRWPALGLCQAALRLAGAESAQAKHRLHPGAGGGRSRVHEAGMLAVRMAIVARTTRARSFPEERGRRERDHSVCRRQLLEAAVPCNGGLCPLLDTQPWAARVLLEHTEADDDDQRDRPLARFRRQLGCAREGHRAKRL